MVHYYSIADHLVVISSDSLNPTVVAPNLEPFVVEKPTEAAPLFSIQVEDNAVLNVILTAFREIGDFDTGNGHIRVLHNDASGDYHYLIRNIQEQPVATLLADRDFSTCTCHLLCETEAMKRFALNNALMLAYAFAGARRQTLLIHASTVKKGDYAYAFIARSGTGKSTQVNNWLNFIPDTELLNDDNPVVRVFPDAPARIYGSPWSGKTPCYRQLSAKLGAITRIVRAPKNFVEKARPVQALASVLPSCSTMKWDKAIYDSVLDTLTTLVTSVPIFALHCLPDRESAEVCHAAIAVKE